jgi:hypothetical protein
MRQRGTLSAGNDGRKRHLVRAGMASCKFKLASNLGFASARPHGASHSIQKLRSKMARSGDLANFFRGLHHSHALDQWRRIHQPDAPTGSLSEHFAVSDSHVRGFDSQALDPFSLGQPIHCRCKGRLPLLDPNPRAFNFFPRLSGVSAIREKPNSSVTDHQQARTSAEPAQIPDIRKVPYEDRIQLVLGEFLLQQLQAGSGAHVPSLSHLGCR